MFSRQPGARCSILAVHSSLCFVMFAPPLLRLLALPARPSIPDPDPNLTRSNNLEAFLITRDRSDSGNFAARHRESWRSRNSEESSSSIELHGQVLPLASNSIRMPLAD